MMNKLFLGLIFLLISCSSFSDEKTENYDFYLYKANIVSVYDGDTVTANIDLGLNVWVHGQKLRLARINAPEVRGKQRPAGLKARDWLRNKIKRKSVVLRTIKDRKGKYGRYIVEIFNGGVNVNDALVKKGFAEYYEY